MHPLPSRWRILEYSHRDPYINYAVDEAVQYQVGKAGAPETVRIWEPKVPAVYIGLGQDLDAEVNVAACRQDRVAILRRHSGGGAVYAAPGVLYVSFALRLETYPELNNIPHSYRHLSGLLTGIFKDMGLEVGMQGTSDLTVGDRKVAGQAQARKYRCLLHQVSLIFSVDVDRMGKYLAMPSRVPSYRGKRTHRDFIAMLGNRRQAPFVKKLKNALKGSRRSLSAVEFGHAQDLALKYQDEGWTLKKQKGESRRPSIKIASG